VDLLELGGSLLFTTFVGVMVTNYVGNHSTIWTEDCTQEVIEDLMTHNFGQKIKRDLEDCLSCLH
jgi:hypothetical protein